MASLKALPRTVARRALAYWRRLRVRVVLMGSLALIALAVAEIMAQVIPREVGTMVTGAAADRLLDIIANAMLVVTTFSLTVMVSLYQSSSSQFTPRIHRLIMEDPITQNTLATFIGAYVYALVAIVLREVRIFSDDKALALFAMTALVLVLIVFALIRWTLHLQEFGTLLDTTRQAEARTRQQFRERLEHPCHGANPLIGPVPESARPIAATSSGYLQVIHDDSLDGHATDFGVDIYLNREVGSFIYSGEAMAYVVETGTAAVGAGNGRSLDEILRDHLPLSDLRSYDHDPRFGLVVLGEIASKALSPGINDPGTAIEILTRSGRILLQYRSETGDAVRHKRLWVPPLDPDDLLADAFGAIARDGAGVIEVQLRLQKTLAALSRHPDASLAAAARRASSAYLARAMAALDVEAERSRLRNVAGAVAPTPGGKTV